MFLALTVSKMWQLNALRDSKAIENLIYIQVLICLILDLSDFGLVQRFLGLGQLKGIEGEFESTQFPCFTRRGF